MYTKRALELLPLLDDPNVRVMLGIISRMEGTSSHGYETAFGGGKLPNLDRHPKTSHKFTQTDGKKSKTSAAGRYQFLGTTWDEEAKELGVTDFSPASQDLAALSRIQKRGVLDKVLAGDFKGAIGGLGNEWASAPSAPEKFKQPKKSWADIDMYIEAEMGQPAVADMQVADAPPAVAMGGEASSDPLSVLAPVAQSSGLAPSAEITPPDWAALLPKTVGAGAYLEPIMNLEPWENELLMAGVSRDADQARHEAVSTLLGLTAAPSSSLPKQIDKTINKIVASL